MKLKRSLILMFFTGFAILSQGQDSWAIDQSNSSIQFKIGHLLISSINGGFNDFTAQIMPEKENSFDHAKLESVIKVESIDTGNNQRDKHLLQSDFFEVNSFPEITFNNATLVFTNEDSFQVSGDLSIKSVTKRVTFNGTFGGYAEMWGQERAGFSAIGKINRFDFGISFNDTLDSGGLVVGEEVTFILNLEFVKQN